jgi:eukaryotic-like serine/threonine-protein kinase
MITDCQRPRSRTDATRPRAPVHADAGALLAGRYRLAELVGRGATARVWRARDELLNRDVAVKQLRGRQPHGILEARIAARVRHPNVVAVHDVVSYDDSY